MVLSKIKNFFRRVVTRNSNDSSDGFSTLHGDHRRFVGDASSQFNIYSHHSGRDNYSDDCGAETRFSRPNIATILIIILLTLVFLVLPVFYLFHCFDLWYTGGDTGYRLVTFHSRSTEDFKLQHAKENEKVLKPQLHSHQFSWEDGHHNILKTHSSVGDDTLSQQKNQINFAKPPQNGKELNPQLEPNESLLSHSIMSEGREFKSINSTPKKSPYYYKRSKIRVENSEEECAAIKNDFRFDCHPGPNPTKEECQRRSCCWLKPLPQAPDERQYSADVPYCFYPYRFNPYSLINMTRSSLGLTASVERSYASPYPDTLKMFEIDFTYETKDRLHFKIYDPKTSRFEPPYPEVPVGIRLNSFHEVGYDVHVHMPDFGFQVIRKSDNTTLFDTINAGTIEFADQLLQISSLLPSDNIYGLGEHRSTLKLSTDFKRYVMFNADQHPIENSNLYGSHPFYLVFEKSGQCHGVFLKNSNALEAVLQPAPAVTFRALGGIFDFYIFLGPTPSDVIKQYTEVIGRPFMPPMWALGFHLSRYGYKDLNDTIAVFERTREAKIPYDVQWNDLDYMSHNDDFTYNRTTFLGLPHFVQKLHQVGMHYVPIIDPGISAGEPWGTYAPYDQGLKMDVFVKNSSGKPFIGKVWNPVSTVWPDFTHPNTVNYWMDQLWQMYSEFNFDGAWIDMNEPSNFLSGTVNGCENDPLNYPPYVPPLQGGKMFSRTICMTAEHYIGKHYNVHNLYGLTEAIVTNFVLSEIRGKRPFVISRSTFPGIGHYAGHWSGDIYSSWYDMMKTIPELLSFSLFGVPLMGADICGFDGNTTVELCQRWMQLGAFYPFCRNHNSDENIPQDPVSLGHDVTVSARKSLLTRYSLLPYLYTLFWQAHVEGATVARPLFFEFPNDEKTYENDRSFMWGSCLLIAPVLQENCTRLSVYFPPSVWYDFYSGVVITDSKEGDTVVVDAPLDTIPLFIKGGSIIPMQTPLTTIKETAAGPFQLLVTCDANKTSRGMLYWDDGDSLNSYENGKYSLIEFHLENRSLSSDVKFWGYKSLMILDKVTFLGVDKPVTSVIVNGMKIKFFYSSYKKSLVINNLRLHLNESIYVSWM